MVKVQYQGKELRVKWAHYTETNDVVEKRGTECVLFDETGDPCGVGASYLHPKDKVFNKKLGRQISLGRALVDFGIQNQSERKRLIAEAGCS